MIKLQCQQVSMLYAYCWLCKARLQKNWQLSLSLLQKQDECIPHGSIVSVILFSIKISNTLKCVNPKFLCMTLSKHIHTMVSTTSMQKQDK